MNPCIFFFGFFCLSIVEEKWNAELFRLWRVSCSVLALGPPLAALDFRNCAAERIRLLHVSWKELEHLRKSYFMEQAA